MPTNPVLAVLTITIHEDSTKTRLEHNPGKLPLTRISDELLVAATHLAHLDNNTEESTAHVALTEDGAEYLG